MLTRNELVGVMPGAAGMADRVVPALDAAMQRFDIGSPARRAAFLAQLAHESGELQRWTENLGYRWQRLRQVFPKYFRTDAEAQPFDRKPERIANRVYGGRMGNGPEASGDGWRYRGRGPIQLTGKDNYRTCGEAIGIDLVNEPERLETPEAGCLAAAWFWASRGLNTVADAGDFVTITKRINGGLIGLEHRTAVWKRAKEVFGVAAPVAAATRARRGIARAGTLERAKKAAAGARRKPAKPRGTPTTARTAAAKAGQARVAAAKKSDAKASTPRAATAKKTAARVSKPRTATTKKAETKTAAVRIAAARKAATKTAKPRVSAAKKAGTKPAKPRITRARNSETKVVKPHASAAGKAVAKAARSRTPPARKVGTTAAKPRAAAATLKGKVLPGAARDKALKKAPRKASKPGAPAIGRTIS
jgi:putative chitinase